jgi:hypothetical protein
MGLTMLDARLSNAFRAARHFPRSLREVLRRLGAEPDEDQDLAVPRTTLSPDQAAHAGDNEFPAILRKAQDHVACRKALASLGYSQVRAAYARHRQEGLDTFEDLGDAQLWPTLEFVRDWLKEERARMVAQVRWSFGVAMLATILAGLTFVATIALLG